MLPSSMPARADYLLLFIAIALAAGFGWGVASPLSLGAGGAAGSVVASVAVVDGVALNPPTEN